MKILLLSAYAYPHVGGIETSLYFMGRELLRQGHHVKLLCFRNPPELPEFEIVEGVEIHRIQQQAIRWPAHRMKVQVHDVYKALHQLFNDFQPDRVWSRFLTFGLAASALIPPSRLAHIFPTTGFLGVLPYRKGGFSLKKRLLHEMVYFSYRKLEAKLLPRCSPIVFSDLMRRQLQMEYPTFEGNISLIRPGVDTDFFQPCPIQERAFLRKSLGLSEQTQLVLFVGRLAKSKNLHVLIRAMSQLPTHCHLLVVGKGDDEEEMRQLTNVLDMTNRVHFVGPQHKKLPLYYSIADVCVLPTYIETFGQTYLEAMACGTPVIGFSSRLPQCRNATDEIIEDGITGKIVMDLGHLALAKAISRILTQPSENILSMGKAARIKVIEEYNWEKFTENLINNV